MSLSSTRFVHSQAVDYQEIHYQVKEPSAIITLNRPDRLNAWTHRMGEELRHALAQAESDSRVVGIIITGADRAFCAGADKSILDEIKKSGKLKAHETDMPGQSDIMEGYRHTYSYIASIQKPVIAAIHGACIGMAIPVSLFCDLRFASDEAYFITAFAQRGLIAEWGSSWLLSRFIGQGNALDLLLSSRKVLAQEALTMGLVNRVFPHATLLDAAQKYIATLAQQCSPVSMAIIKRQVYDDWMLSLEQANNNAEEKMLASFLSADFAEGVDALIEKRSPNFQRIGK